MVDLQAQWKKEGWAARAWTRGFSEWIDIKAQPVVNASEAFDKVTAGDSLTKVRNAFMKGAEEVCESQPDQPSDRYHLRSKQKEYSHARPHLVWGFSFFAINAVDLCYKYRVGVEYGI